MTLFMITFRLLFANYKPYNLPGCIWGAGLMACTSHFQPLDVDLYTFQTGFLHIMDKK